MKTTYQVALLLSVFTLIVFSNAYAADPKAELQTKLASLNPISGFAATVQIKKTRTEIEDEKKETTQSELQIGLRDDSTGFHVSIPEAVFKQVQIEKESADAEEETSGTTSTLLSSLDLPRLKELTSFSSEIQDMLDDAELTKQSNEEFAGKLTRKLNFDVSLEIPEDFRDDIDEVEATLAIWIDAKSGMPVALAKSHHIAGSKFFIDFNSYEKNTYLLDIIDGRLVATSVRREAGGSSIGPKIKTVTKITLTQM